MKEGDNPAQVQSPAKVHAFAHLGEYPYTYLGYEYLTYQACPGAPVQVGGACDHCLTGIKDAFIFRSADGKVFKVGSTCVNKAGDKGLKRLIDDDVKKIRRERKAQRDEARIQAAMAFYGQHKDYFDTLPHPQGFTDRETGDPLTFADWLEWMVFNAGTAGKLRMAKKIGDLVETNILKESK